MNAIVDAIVVGQGLAGTALTWTLLKRGARVLVADSGRPGASAVAAGLVTPVTGQALRATPDFEGEYAVAAAHYRSVQSAIGSVLWHERPSLRIAQTEIQAQRLRQRLREPASGLSDVREPTQPALRDVLDCALMTQAARLDVAAYVARSAEEFRRRGILKTAGIEPADVSIRADGQVSAAGLLGRYLVWCRGYYDHDNPWLPPGALSPAKGEIIDLEIAGWRSSRTVHSGGHWLLPQNTTGKCAFGATYDHSDLDPQPTTTARQKLREQAAKMLSVPFEITDQRAGIRPVGAGRRPITGAHPVHKQILLLNGLGSKGVLWAPTEAAKLCAMILPDNNAKPA